MLPAFLPLVAGAGEAPSGKVRPAPPVPAPAAHVASAAHRRSKRIVARANHRSRGCYHAVVSGELAQPGLAYLRVENRRESLVYLASLDEPERILARETYVLSPHFAGGFLFWVERMGKDWRLRAIDRDDPQRVFEPWRREGRPLSPTSCTGGNGTSYLAWEERSGRHTRLWMGCLRGKQFTGPVPLTSGDFNAYDPALAVAADGTLYLACCAFVEGNYRVLLQRFSDRGAPLGDPVRVSNQDGASLAPSLWPRRDGGVWISYASYDGPSEGAEGSCPFSYRSLAQRSFFLRTSNLYVILYDRNQFLAPYAGPVGAQGYVAAGHVGGGNHACNSQVFEDVQGHKHSTISVCQRENDRDPHWAYRFMQDVQHARFGGLTDHCLSMWPTEMLYTRKLAEYYYFPGEFVAFQAYEWPSTICKEPGGHNFGHMNPILLEEGGDLEMYIPPEPHGGAAPDVWRAYRGQRIITPPHHTANDTHRWNWDYHDPQFVRVVEVFQDYRGSSEQPHAIGVTNYLHQEEGHWVRDGLRRGYRFGLIAGGDHCGCALGGVLLKELTRSGLYEALFARRTLATTGKLLSLLFTCNGAMMGEEVHAERGDFRLSVEAPEPIRELQIVHDGEEYQKVRVRGTKAEHHWSAARKTPGEYWYCRVLFEDGHVAWSSPIWLM